MLLGESYKMISNNYKSDIKMYLWNLLKDTKKFGGKDGVIDGCINQTKKKAPRVNTLDALLLPVWGVYMAPLFYCR